MTPSRLRADLQWHDARCSCEGEDEERCSCGSYHGEELDREQRSHDAEINRITDALDLPDDATVEDIVKEIKRLRKVEKEVGL